MDHEVRKPRAGAVRYMDTYSGEYHIVEPRNVMYSTAIMVATEYWDEKSDSWKLIDIPEANNA